MVALMVSGMTCGGCAAAVERVIKAQDPAASVTVDLASGRVEANTTADADSLAKAITKAGFETKAA